MSATGPDRGRGRARTAGTVLEACPHPDTPDAQLGSVLWDDQGDARPYAIAPDTLQLWTLLPPPRVYTTGGARPARSPR